MILHAFFKNAIQSFREQPLRTSSMQFSRFSLKFRRDFSLNPLRCASRCSPRGLPRGSLQGRCTSDRRSQRTNVADAKKFHRVLTVNTREAMDEASRSKRRRSLDAQTRNVMPPWWKPPRRRRSLAAPSAAPAKRKIIQIDSASQGGKKRAKIGDGGGGRREGSQRGGIYTSCLWRASGRGQEHPSSSCPRTKRTGCHWFSSALRWNSRGAPQ